MSHDGLDEETARLLAEVDSDDSKSEIKKDKSKFSTTSNDEDIWETNTEDTPDSEW